VLNSVCVSQKKINSNLCEIIKSKYAVTFLLTYSNINNECFINFINSSIFYNAIEKYLQSLVDNPNMNEFINGDDITTNWDYYNLINEGKFIDTILYVYDILPDVKSTYKILINSGFFKSALFNKIAKDIFQSYEINYSPIVNIPDFSSLTYTEKLNTLSLFVDMNLIFKLNILFESLEKEFNSNDDTFTPLKN
jgi:hypothetical protein